MELISYTVKKNRTYKNIGTVNLIYLVPYKE